MRKIRTIPRTFFIGLLFVSVLTTSVIGYLWISQQFRTYREEIQNLQSQKMSERKESLKQEVIEAVDYANYMDSQVNETLSNLLQERVQIAHEIASHLYETNQSLRSEEEIRELVLQALRPVRFGQDQDPVSVSTMEGEVLIQFLDPELTGTNLLENGSETIANGMKLAIEVVRRQDEGFVSYSWFDQGLESERRAYVKHFEPFDWIIATGVYVKDIEKTVQKKVLDRLEKENSGRADYLFAGQYDGMSLLGPKAGENMIDLQDPNGVKLVQELIQKAKSGGGFVSYVMPKFEGHKPLPKISFAKGIDTWGWYIGVGTYIDDIEKEMAELEQEMVSALHWNVKKILLFLILLLTIIIMISRWLSSRLNISFGAFVSFFKRSASENAVMEPESLHFVEFKELAESANQMIRERSLMEQSLKEREATLQSILAASPVGICLVRAGRIEWTNGTLPEMFGYKEEEIIGKPVGIFNCRQDYNKELGKGVKDYIELGDSEEVCLAKRDGGCLDTLVSSAPLDGADNLNGMIITILDISERKKAIETRNSFFNLSMDMLCIARLDGHFIMVNPAFQKILGWSKETLLEKTWLYFVHPDDIDATIQTGQTLIEGNPVVGFENRYKCKDGSYRWLSWNSFPVPEEGIAFAVARDVTENKKAEEERTRLEQQLRHSQKMEAVGQLAGGVAHDFNNLLQAITGYSSLILQRISSEDPIYPEMLQVKRAADKAAVLTSRLLAFSRQQVLEPENVDLNEVVLSLTSMIQRVIGEHINLRFNPSGQSVSVMADPGQIEQVLLNLCVNSRDAMEKGGQILIETGRVHLDKKFSDSHSLQGPGDYVELKVTDTGCGMSEDVAEKAFEPFFTTKEVGKGTGLGLASVYGIVRQHKGTVLLSSETGTGTTVSIFLPATEEVAEVKDTEIPSPVEGGDETILIAEDDAQVREWLENILNKSGYKVLSTKDGVEALEVFEESRKDIDMIILDAVMPSLGGEAVYEHVKIKAPDIPVLFATGYSPEGILTSQEVSESVQVIKKPFTSAELLTIVRNTLDKLKKT